ncbi:TPA: hypothetical protein ACIBOM_000866 [Salmonella enterica subsp. enterica serovar Reading]
MSKEKGGNAGNAGSSASAGAGAGGGVTVYISPDIVAALNARFEENAEAGKKVGLDPLCTIKPSIGWMVRSYLRCVMNMKQTHGAE